MGVLEFLSDLVSQPIEAIANWLSGLGSAIGEILSNFFHQAGVGIGLFIIDGITCIAVSYLTFCAYRIIISSSDKKLNEYTNKCMVAGVVYFFAKVGGKMALNILSNGCTGGVTGSW